MFYFPIFTRFVSEVLRHLIIGWTAGGMRCIVELFFFCGGILCRLKVNLLQIIVIFSYHRLFNNPQIIIVSPCVFQRQLLFLEYDRIITITIAAVLIYAKCIHPFVFLLYLIIILCRVNVYLNLYPIMHRKRCKIYTK